MARTLVTGAAGFTGSYLVPLLAERGDDVHAIVHHEPDQQIDGVGAIHVADLAQLDALRRIVAEIRQRADGYTDYRHGMAGEDADGNITVCWGETVTNRV